MKKNMLFLFFLLIAMIPGLYAEDTSGTGTTLDNPPKSDSAIKGIAQGVKRVAYEGPKDFVEETAEEAPEKPPIVNMVEGVNKGTEKLVDHTIKGAYRVATLGKSELKSYEVEEPEKGSDKPTRFKISIPGT